MTSLAVKTSGTGSVWLFNRFLPVLWSEFITSRKARVEFFMTVRKMS